MTKKYYTKCIKIDNKFIKKYIIFTNEFKKKKKKDE